MKDRHCEICGAHVGRMSDAAWEQMERVCDRTECVEKIAELNPWRPDPHYQAQYAYACGYHN